MKPEEKPTGPQSELIGSWKLVDVEHTTPQDGKFKVADVVYKFTETQMIARAEGKLVMTAKYELDTSKTPYQIKAFPTKGEKKEVTMTVEISGNKLRLGSPDHVEVLERVPD
jgi:uncharacterized protein (TIGR03067 family)